MSSKRTTESNNETVSSDLGPEIDIPVSLRYPFQPFWQSEVVLSIHENGFRLQKSGKTTVIPYRAIESVAWSESDRYANGILIGTKFDVVLKIGSERLRLRHSAPIDTGDSFGSFLKNVTQQVANAARNKMELGGILEGQNWSLSRTGLKVGTRITDWHDIADVDFIDGQVTVWLRQRTYPAYRIPGGSSQARVLLELLDRFVSEQPVSEGEGALGRFLFRRQTHQTLRAFVLFVSIVLFALAGWLFFRTQSSLLLSLLFLFLSAVSLTYSLLLWRRVYDFHQHGIIQRPGYRVFLFKNCDSMKYESRMQYVNAVYGFTRINMRLTASSPPGTLSIRTQCYGNDRELERMKTKLAAQIADRMYAKINSGGDVLWGTTAKISKEEIHYLSTRILGGTTRYNVRFSESLAYTIDAGKFRLYRSGESIPLLVIDCEEENFYPGFFLLLRLFN